MTRDESQTGIYCNEVVQISTPDPHGVLTSCNVVRSIRTYVYATFTACGHEMTERIELDLSADELLESARKMLHEFHRLTGTRPSGVALAMPAEAASVLRTDRMFQIAFGQRIAGDWNDIRDLPRCQVSPPRRLLQDDGSTPMKFRGETVSRATFVLPYPRHPELCEPETICTCGDALSEHVPDVAIGRMREPENRRIDHASTTSLLLRRKNGSYLDVLVPNVERVCRGRWADKRCPCRDFIEATPTQVAAASARRTHDEETMPERMAAMWQSVFDSIYRSPVADAVLRSRCRDLAHKHGCTAPDEIN